MSDKETISIEDLIKKPEAQKVISNTTRGPLNAEMMDNLGYIRPLMPN